MCLQTNISAGKQSKKHTLIRTISEAAETIMEVEEEEVTCVSEQVSEVSK